MANSYYAKKKEESDRKIQAALEARSKRTSSNSQSSTSTSLAAKKEAQEQKINDALSARSKRIESSLPEVLSDLQKNLTMEVDSYNSTKPVFGQYDDTYKTQRERRIRISKLRNKINAYRSYMDSGVADSLLSSLDQMEKGYDAYLGMSQFNSKEEFDTAIRYYGYQQKYAGKSYEEIQTILGTLEDGEERDWLSANQYDAVRTNADYDSRSTAGWEKYLADQEAQRQAQKETREDESFLDKLGRWLGPAGAVDTTIPLGNAPEITHNLSSDTSYLEPGQNWTNDQKGVYGYLYDADKTAAGLYAKNTTERNNQAENAEKIAAIEAWATKNVWTGSAATLGAIAMMPLSLADTLSALTEYNARGFVSTSAAPLPGQVSNAITGAISSTLNGVDEEGVAHNILNENIPVIGGKGLGDAYQLATSIANSMITANTQGPLGTYLVFFGSASSSGMYDAKSRGATDSQAITLGVLNGLAEAAGEAFSAEKLLSLSGVKELESFFANLLLQAGIEASEEGVTTLLNTFADKWVMKDKSNYGITVSYYMNEKGMSREDAEKQANKDWLNDVAFDILGGAISGFSSAGLQTGVKTMFVNRTENKRAQQIYGADPGALVSEALEIAPDNTYAQKMQGKLDSGKQLSGRQLNRLVQQNEAALTAQDLPSIQSAAESRLTELGETGDVSSVAAALAKQVKYQSDYKKAVRQFISNGYTKSHAMEKASEDLKDPLSRSERQIISSSKYGQRVANELNTENIRSGGYSSAWTENIGTERINAEEYSRLVEAAQVPQEAAEVAGGQVAMEAPNAAQVAQAEPVETSTATIRENRTVEQQLESQYEVSAEGKAELGGKEVVLNGLRKAQDGSVVVATADNQTADPGEVKYPSKGHALVYESYANIESTAGNPVIANMDVDARSILARAYNPAAGVAAKDYFLGSNQAYWYGFEGISMNEKTLPKNSLIRSISEEQRNLAYDLGRKAGKQAAQTQKAGIQAAYEKAVEKLGGKEAAAAVVEKNKGEMVLEDGIIESTMTKQQKASYNLAMVVAESVSSTIHVYRGMNEYGKYDPDTGDIWLNINGNFNGSSMMAFTLAHELVHMAKQWNPADFKAFADYLLEQYGKKGVSVESLIQAQMNNAKLNEYTLDEHTAYEEVIADACQRMLLDSDAVQKMAAYKEQNPSNWQKIVDKIREFITSIRNLFKGAEPDSMEAALYKSLDEDAKQYLEKLFVDMVMGAGEHMSTIQNAFGKGTVVEVNADGEFTLAKGEVNGATKFLYNDYTWERGGRDTLRAALKAEGFSKEDIDAAMTIMDGKHNLVKELAEQFPEQDRINQATVTTDLKDGHSVLSALVSNGDYPVNIDLLMVCKKRKAYQRVIDRLCETGMIQQATVDALAIAEINKILGKYGFETACLGCFVESRRLRIQEWANTIVKEWNAEVKKRNPGAKAFGFGKGEGTLTPDEVMQLIGELESGGEKNEQGNLNLGQGSAVKRMGVLLDKVPSLRKTLSVEDLITPDGLTALRKFDSNLFSMVKSRYGSNSPKFVQEFNPYNHELAKYGKVPSEYKSLRDYLYAIGGARMQSFSDFIVENWFDYCQIVADLAARKLPMHTYTKEISLAKLFGLTGIKINMSLIPDIDRSLGKEFAGLTRNAKGELELIWADKDRYKATGGKSYMQSINFADAIALQNDPRYSANVGTIAVGVSDKHILTMLDDARVRMIIPYHSSGMNPIFADLMGTSYYKDYTMFQNTTVKQLYNSKGQPVSLKLDKTQNDKLVSGFQFNEVLQELGDARAAAQAYKDWCADASKHTITIKGETYTAELTPKFDSFSWHDNYYKLLEDFNTYDCISEEAAQQGDVQQIYPEDFDQILKGELTAQETHRQKQVENQAFDKAMGEIESYLSTHTKADTVFYAEQRGVKLSAKDKKLGAEDKKKLAELRKGEKYSMPKVFTDAVEKFGTTTDFEETGFILPSGEMLKFTDDNRRGERQYDHRAIGMVYGVDVDLSVNHGFNKESGKFLDEFVENGGIRFDAGDPSLNMDIGLQLSSTNPLTKDQEQIIRDLVEWKVARESLFESQMTEDDFLYRGPLAIRIDFGGDSNYAVGAVREKDLSAWGKKSLEYEGGNINADRIIADIRHYYQTGETRRPSSIAKFRYSMPKKRTFTYNELVARGSITGEVIKSSEYVHMKNGKIDEAWVIDQVKSNCKQVQTKSDKPTYYAEAPDIGRNVQIINEGITHGFGEYKNNKNGKPSPAALINARVTLNLVNILRTAIEVNQSRRGSNIDVPFSHIMLGVAGLENADGTVDYYGVRIEIEERVNQDAILVGANVLGRLYAANAKKISSPHAQVIGGADVALATGSFAYNIADLIKDVKHEFDDTFSTDVYRKLKASRRKNDFSANLLHKNPNSHGMSPRQLLADAFDELVQSPKEREKMDEYRKNISMVEDVQERLRKLRGEISRLTKANGDKGKIAELNKTAKGLADLIDRYDRKLLELEASKPLRDVLVRARSAAYQEAKRRSDENMREYRQQVSERFDRGVEGRRKTEMRKKIRKVIRDLDKILNRGDKKRNVKEDMKDFVAEALSAAEVLFTDNYTNEDIIRNGFGVELSKEEAKYLEEARGLMEELSNLPVGGYDAWQARREAEETLKNKLAYRMSKLKDAFFRERQRLNKAEVAGVLGNLADAYAKLETSEYAYINGAYHEAVYEYLKMLQEDVGGAKVKDMTLGQLEELYKAYTMVLTTVRNANKMFAEDLNQSKEELANRVMMEVYQAGGEHGLWSKGQLARNQASWNNTKPIYAAERTGSPTFVKLVSGFFKGQYKWATDMEEAKAFRQKIAEKYGFKAWDMEKTYKFTSSSGIEFELNLNQIMSLYAYAKREQAHDHLLKGGFVFGKNTEVVVTKNGIKRTYLNKSAKAHNISDEIMGEIIGKLTKEQKGFVDEMQDYLSTTMGGKGNEVSLRLYGVKLFTEKFYFPLRSAGQYKEKAKEAELKQQQGQISIANSGFTKSITPKASNPVVLDGFTDVWASHVNEMSMYHSMVLPMEDFRRVYNYASPNMEGQEPVSVNSTIENAYGDAATGYFDQLYNELNGGAIVDPRENLSKQMIGRFKKSAVMLSNSVWVQQFSAIGRAYALIDPKHFIGPKIDKKKHAAAWNELKQYAPVAIIKEMGGFDTHTGLSAKDYLLAEEYGKGERVKGFIKDEQYRGEVMGLLPAKADELTWCAIWEAVKRETKATYPKMDVKSEEFLKKAGKRFSEVVEKTQVYDSVLARSANMRSKQGLMQMLTAFMAEPTTTVNMVEDALRKGNKKTIARTFGAVAASIILNNALASIVYAMRDDDEDESWIEKYAQAVTSGMLDDINPMTYYPILKDIWSLFQGYDVERTDMAIYSDISDSVKKAVTLIAKYDPETDDAAEFYKEIGAALMGILDAGAAAFGVPLKNVRRDLMSYYNTFNTLKSGGKTTWNSFVDAIGGAALDTIPIVGLVAGDSKQDKLYDAIVSRDAVYVNRLKSGYKDQNAINNAIRKGLRENDPRIREAAIAWNGNDLDEYMRIAREIIAEKHFGQDDVVMAIRSEASALAPDAKTETASKAKGLFTEKQFAEAISQRNAAMAKAIKMDVIQTYIKNGKTAEEAEKSFASSAKSNLKDQFLAGNISENEVVSALTTYCGIEKDDATADVQYWAFKQDYPDVYADDQWFDTYYEKVANSGLGIDVYMEYRNKVSTITGEGKKEKRMSVIDSLPVTSAQKDALYLAEGWAESKLYEAPWH